MKLLLRAACLVLVQEHPVRTVIEINYLDRKLAATVERSSYIW